MNTPTFLRRLAARSGNSPAAAAVLGALVPALLAAAMGCGTRASGARPGAASADAEITRDEATVADATAGDAGRPDQQGPAPDLAAGGGPILEREFLLGDLYGLRGGLEDRGLTFTALYVGDFTKNLRGGLSTRGYDYLDLFDFTLTADLGEMARLPGGIIFADFQNTHGSSLSGDVGDIQGVDNIETDGRTQLAQLYYQQSLADEQVVLAAGKIDANARFAVAENAGEFVNSSPGQSPTIFALPAYPDPAFGAEAFVAPGDRFYAGVGFFDGSGTGGVPTGSRGPRSLFSDNDGYFLVAEGGPQYALAGGDLPGRLGVGAWYTTAEVDTFAGGSRGGTGGVYVIFDQTLYKTNPEDADDARGLAAFAQYGYADRDVSEIDHHVGGGLVAVGALPGREDDAAGVAATYVHLSELAGFARSYELALETFYKVQVTPAVSVKPDLQYVINPSGGGDARDALVGIVRVEIAF